MSQKTDRRSFLASSLLGAGGFAAASTLEEKSVAAALQSNAVVSDEEIAEASKDPMPCGTLGKVKISRLMLGSNLIGGFAHSRDLLYVSQLFKLYNTEERIFDTFELAEKTGINAILTNPNTLDHVCKYNAQRGGKLQPIVYVRPYMDPVETKEEVERVVDKGACAISLHGGVVDDRVRLGELEPIGKAIEIIKSHGLPAGIGGHSLHVPKTAEKENLGADFYHKTLHRDDYWSATPKESRKEFCWQKGMTSDHDGYHDNMFCLDPEETIEFMATVKKPWIAFKVLAAGAIHPRKAFPHAYRGGADFICCGMFDFQVCDDALVAKKALSRITDRPRPWYA